MVDSERLEDNQFYKALIAYSSDAIVLTDTYLNTFYRSPNAAKITGWHDRERKVMDDASILIHPDDKADFQQMLSDIKQVPESSVTMVYRLLHKDGHYIWVEVKATNLLSHPPLSALMFTYRDVTSERLFQEQQALLASIVNSSDNAIISKDLNGTVLSWNNAASRILGYQPEEAIGRHVSLIIPAELIEEENRIIEQIKKGRTVDHFSTLRRTKNGTLIDVSLTVSPIRDQYGNIVGASKTLRDITLEKKQKQALIRSEELYRNLFNNLLHGFAYCQAILEDGKVTDYRYILVNAEFERQSGLYNVTGKTVNEVNPELLKSDPFFTNLVQRVVTTGMAEKAEIYVAPIVQWFAVALYCPEPGYFVSLIDNITDRKQSELSLQRNLEELERSNRELEQFAYIASHDLQEPLRMVVSYMQLLERRYKDALDQDAEKFIRFAVDGALRMKRLVGDLLHYSRSSTAQRVVAVDMNEVMAEVMQNLRKSIEDSQAIILFAGLPVIKADKTQMIQLLQNLISNAIKFRRPARSPEVQVTAEKQDDCWLWSVSDNGIGIDEKYSSRIFLIFKQLHTRETYEGTGIGLAIAKKIVEHYHGRIWFESGKDGGTIFYFTVKEKFADEGGWQR